MAIKKPWDVGSESIARAEHISPDKSGDNIEAKKVAGYVWNATTSEWQRDTGEVTIKETSPTSSDKLNASYKIHRNANDEVVKIEKIIGATTYTRLITPKSGDTTITGYDTIGVWS
jgi:hypothetical protein